MSRVGYLPGRGYGVVTAASVVLLAEGDGIDLGQFWSGVAIQQTPQDLFAAARAARPGGEPLSGFGCVVTLAGEILVGVTAGVDAWIESPDKVVEVLRCPDDRNFAELRAVPGAVVSLCCDPDSVPDAGPSLGSPGLFVLSGVVLAKVIQVGGPPRRPRTLAASAPASAPASVDSVAPADAAEPVDPEGRAHTPPSLSRLTPPDTLARRDWQSSPVEGTVPGVEPSPAGRGVALASVRCAAGHPNPPRNDRCRHCGETLPPVAEVEMASVPRLGVARFTTGQVVDLTESVVVGRNPGVAPVGTQPTPSVVRIAGNAHVSRTHLEIRLDGWQVSVIDLSSSNGTTVLATSGDPVRLEPGVPHEIEPWSVVELTEDVSFRYEVP